MRKILTSLSIKIWLPFASFLLILLILLSIFYPEQQSKSFRKNKERELNELAKTVALGVELSLRNNDFKGLQQSIQFVSNMEDFEYVAILTMDSVTQKESVFISYPEKKPENILVKDKEQYLYQRHTISTPELKGVIEVAISMKKINALIDEINRPIYYSLLFIFSISLVIFFLIAGIISKPIVKLTQSAKFLEMQAYDKVKIPFLNRKDEIGGLAGAFESLKNSLLFQKKQNDELTANLEKTVIIRTDALQQTQNQLLDAQNLARLGHYQYNFTTDTWSNSEVLDDILGIDKNFVRSKENWFLMIAPMERDRVKNQFRNALVNKQRFESDFEILQPLTNHKLWVNCIGTFTWDNDGQAIKLTGTIQDISERKQNEETVRRLSYVAQYTSNCVIIADKHKKIEWVNESLIRLTGYSFDEIVGKKPSIFQFEKTDVATIREISDKLNRLELVNTEVLNRGKNGNEYWLEINIVPIFGERGEHTGYVAVETDITERKKTEERLRKNQEELKRINETLEQKVIENTQKNIDLSKSIIEYEKLATIGEIAAGVAHDLNTPLGAIRVGAEIALSTLKQLISNELFNLSKSDFYFILNLSTQINIDGISGGIQSRKEKSEISEHLSNLNTNSIQNPDELADMFVKCRITLKDKDLINQILSKQDPQQILSTFHQIQVMQKILGTINISVDKASNVIKDLRAFIKEDTTVNRGKINLKENISSVLNIFNYELKKDVNLEFNIDSDIYVFGFDIKLFQLWSNLVKNALDAMDSSSNKQLSIIGKVTDDHVSVELCNNGPDIEPEIQDRIFQKFFTTKQHKSGTGLGLSIVKNVLDDHGGSIQLHSGNGKTCFTVMLPKWNQG